MNFKSFGQFSSESEDLGGLFLWKMKKNESSPKGLFSIAFDSDFYADFEYDSYMYFAL